MALSVLLPTDGSPSALHAADWLNDTANPDKVEVTLMYVIAPRMELGMERFFTDARLDSLRILEETESRLTRHRTLHKVTALGMPAEEIIRYAIDHDIGAIVMGRRGDVKVGHWIGSVSFGVFQRCPVPVTIIEPDPE